MNVAKMVLAGLVLSALGSSLRGDDPAPTVADVRKTIERSLPFIEKEGVAWKEERKCASCHRFTFTLWAFHDAKRLGFDVDQRKLSEWTNWTMDTASPGLGADTLAQLLLGVPPSAVSGPQAKRLEDLPAMLTSMMELDGYWKAGGQMPAQNRPGREADEATTLWTLLALNTSPTATDLSAEVRARALEWLQRTRPGTTNESLLLLLLVEQRFGDPVRAQAFLKELLADQHADGGWSWRRSDKGSDAFATGQTLYALGVLGKKADDPAVRRAWKYLIAKQAKDGSWPVNADPISKRAVGKPSPKMDDIYTYWGSTWAAIGLLKTLPEGTGPTP
jgi:squalene-hopene/tetraprenyl-beta-curcumene cyclase